MAPLRTTVIGSYLLPGWLEHAAANLDAFGPDDVAELQEDAVIAAVHDHVAAGLERSPTARAPRRPPQNRTVKSYDVETPEDVAARERGGGEVTAISEGETVEPAGFRVTAVPAECARLGQRYRVLAPRERLTLG